MTSNKFDKAEFVERLQQLISTLNERPTPFAKKIGISRAFMNDVLHLRSGPSVQMLYGITNYRSDINIHWLLTGKGDMLLKERNEVEEQKLLAEYWQTNHRLIEMALKIAYQRVVDDLGQERAEKIFKEVIPSPQVEVMFPHPAGKVHDAGAVAEEEKKQEKGSRNKS